MTPLLWRQTITALLLYRSTALRSRVSMAAPSSQALKRPSELICDARPAPVVVAYLHGFLSGPESFKGGRVREFLKDYSADVNLLSLGSLSGITYTGALESVRTFYESQRAALGDRVKMVLIGSSMGGYIAARYAEMNPEQVDRLVLLCPGYDLHSRWPKLYGPDALKSWEEKGYREFEAKGQTVRVPWAFVADGRSHPAFPTYSCPALVIQGLRDEVVPPETAVAALERSTLVRRLSTVLMVDDDHGLTAPATLATALNAMVEFLGVEPRANQGEGPKGLSAADHVEVEQKFPLHDAEALGEAVRALGGVLKARVLMYDVYWDTPGRELSLVNVWLRQRGGVWELKVPALKGERPQTMAIACYREVTGTQEIAHCIQEMLPHCFQGLKPGEGLEEMLARAGATPLAEYATVRTKYVVDGCVVDVDESSYGYSLVEVEVCVATKEEIPQARNRIRELARRLKGLDAAYSDRPYRGKLEEYLALKDPEHHRRLTQAGIFGT